LSVAIQVHNSVNLSGWVHLAEPARVFANATLRNTKIGAFTYVSPRTILHDANVGRYCSIGSYVTVLSEHPIGSLTTSPFPYEKVFRTPFDPEPLHEFEKILPTTIGNDVWIGSNVQIKTGITIGNGAVIAAGAVVTKDVAPFTVVGGVPAKVIRQRFSKELVDQITEIAWWDYNVLGLEIDWQDPESAITEIKKYIQDGTLTRFKHRLFDMTNNDGKVIGTPIPTS